MTYRMILDVDELSDVSLIAIAYFATGVETVGEFLDKVRALCIERGLIEGSVFDGVPKRKKLQFTARAKKLWEEDLTARRLEPSKLPTRRRNANKS